MKRQYEEVRETHCSPRLDFCSHASPSSGEIAVNLEFADRPDFVLTSLGLLRLDLFRRVHEEIKVILHAAESITISRALLI